MYSLHMFTPIAPTYMALRIFMQMFTPNYPIRTATGIERRLNLQYCVYSH